MTEELEPAVKLTFQGPFFVPSHLTRALVATGIALGATGVALISGAYAAHEFRKVTAQEIAAFIRPPKNG
jgi:hypothetical protein